MMLDSLLSQRWVMEPDALRQMVSLVQRAEMPSPEAIARRRTSATQALRDSVKSSLTASRGNIGIIPVHGMIEQRLSMMGVMMGGVQVIDLEAEFAALLSNPNVSTVAFSFSTPGGSSHGIEAFGDSIYRGREKKRVVGLVDSMAASAGYWLASACSSIIASPGSDAGSIGCYCAHEDISKALQYEGINITLVSAGRFKTEGHPFAPLDAEAYRYLQASVNEVYDAFIDAVARNRDKSTVGVKNGYGQGRLLSADRALEAGMVDVIKPAGAAISMMSKATGASRRVQSSGASVRVEMLRAAHRQRVREASY